MYTVFLHIEDSSKEREKNLRVTHGVDEGLLSITGPVVGELLGLPHNLVHDLGDLDGVGGGAGAARLEGAGRGVGNVALVVGAVEVDAVPASERC